jgi:hypothetical protein
MSAPPIGHEHRILPVIVVLGVPFPVVDQGRLVPLILARIEFAVGLVSVLIPLEQPLGLGLLAGLHPFRDDVGEPTLADHPQDMLAIELPIHSHIIDVNEVLSRIQQLLEDLLA